MCVCVNTRKKTKRRNEIFFFGLSFWQQKNGITNQECVEKRMKESNVQIYYVINHFAVVLVCVCYLVHHDNVFLVVVVEHNVVVVVNLSNVVSLFSLYFSSSSSSLQIDFHSRSFFILICFFLFSRFLFSLFS